VCPVKKYLPEIDIKMPTQSKTKEKILMNKTKPELVKMCIDKNISAQGLKKDLVSRLLNVKEHHATVIEITKNKHGQFLHKDTRLIFDPSTKRVIGRENPENGTIDKLSRNDIELCKNYKFPYKLPETIDDDRTDVYEVIEDGSSNESDTLEDDSDVFDESDNDDF
jgi:hypothetical protein